MPFDAVTQQTIEFVKRGAVGHMHGRLRFEAAVARGEMKGRIIDPPRGRNGFGYDPHFFLPDRGCTTAELSPADKNAISHRGCATRRLLEMLLA